MRATVEISRALAGETDLDVVLELIAKRGRALVEARALVIELVVGDRLRIAAVAGDADRELARRASCPIAGSAWPGTRCAPRRSQRLSRRARSGRGSSESGLGRLGLSAGAGLFVPLAFRNETPGVLVALDPPRRG